jgi:hypothetical protein
VNIGLINKRVKHTLRNCIMFNSIKRGRWRYKSLKTLIFGWLVEQARHSQLLLMERIKC